MDMHTLLCLQWMTNKDTLYCTGSIAQSFALPHNMAAWIGGKFGREWIHGYVWLSPFAVHLKLSQHC